MHSTLFWSDFINVHVMLPFSTMYIVGVSVQVCLEAL